MDVCFYTSLALVREQIPGTQVKCQNVSSAETNALFFCPKLEFAENAVIWLCLPSFVCEKEQLGIQ